MFICSRWRLNSHWENSHGVHVKYLSPEEILLNLNIWFSALILSRFVYLVVRPIFVMSLTMRICHSRLSRRCHWCWSGWLEYALCIYIPYQWFIRIFSTPRPKREVKTLTNRGQVTTLLAHRTSYRWCVKLPTRAYFASLYNLDFSHPLQRTCTLASFFKFLNQNKFPDFYKWSQN